MAWSGCLLSHLKVWVIFGKRFMTHLKKISDLRVLVVMDDLDRIQPNEMREMFRLVKGVADFPNTIYLLSFDREVVIDAIADKSGVNKRTRQRRKISGKNHPNVFGFASSRRWHTA